MASSHTPGPTKRSEADALREEIGYLDYIYHCKGCLNCVQDCTKNILTRVVNPEYRRRGLATALKRHVEVAAIRRGIGLTWGLARTQPAMVQPDLLLQSVRAGRVDAGPDRPRLTRTLVADMLRDVMDRTGEGLSIPLGPFVLILTTGMGGLILDYRVTRDADAVGDAVARFADLLAEQVVPCESARPSACSVLRPLTHEPRSAR